MKNRFILAIPVLAAGAYFIAGAAHGQTGQPAQIQKASDAPKIVLVSGAVKHVGTVVTFDGPATINNRIDSNAILNLESHPIDEAPAAVTPAAAVQPVVAVTPQMRYSNALNSYNQAQKAYTATTRQQNAAAINAARAQVQATKAELAAAKAAIAVQK